MRKRMKHIFLCSIYVWLLITTLIFSIEEMSKYWGYQLINYNKPSIDIYIFIYSFTLIPLLFLPKSLKLPSDYINIYLYIFTFIPAVVVPFFIVKSDVFNYNYFMFIFSLLACILVLLKKKSNNKSIIISLTSPLNKYVFHVVLVLLYVSSTIIFIINFGFKFEIPTLSDVYNVRLQYREIVRESVFSSYMVGWMGYIVNIFLFLRGMQTKNKSLIIFAAIFQLYIFSLMALKSHIAVLILSALAYYFFNRKKELNSIKFIKSCLICFIFVFFIDFISNGFLAQTILTRRVLIVPSQLAYFHFEFFNQNPKTLWGYNIFSIFSDYNYSLSPPKLIGDVYFHRPQMTAVVNIFMEGYTAFGYLGIFLVTLILKFVLNLIDSIFLHRSNENIIMLVFSITMANSINSSSILTVILTHGILIFILLFLFFPNFKKQIK